MTKPRKYQREGIRLIWEQFNGRSILGDEQGLGKTVMALVGAKDYLDPSPIVVVCPATIKEQWRRECARHVGIRATVLYSRKPPRKDPIPQNRIFIINYDILPYWWQWLRKLKPKLIITDEFHNLRSLDTLRTKAWIELCKKVPHVIAMSGTPIVNDHADIYPVLHVLFPKKFKSFFGYAFDYCQPRIVNGRWQYKGAKNGKKLRQWLLENCLVRRLKKDVLKDLPDKIVTVVPIRLTGQRRREYDEAERDIIKWLAKSNPAKAKRARKNKRLAYFHYLSELATNLTMQERENWLRSFHSESDDKILVFGWNVKVLEEFHRKFPDSVLITGATSPNKRQLRIDKFNKNRKVKNFFGNLQAAGTGWNCTASSTIAFMQLGWTAADHNQAIDRAHGIGRGIKGKKLLIYFLVAENTIEEDKVKIITKKQSISDKLLDGKGRASVDNMSIYDELEARLLKRREMK